MTNRRWLLLAGVLGIAMTAPSRVRASGETDVEGASYGGTGAGVWTCGPRARVNYVGGAVHARFAENTARLGGTGVTADLAGAVEEETVKIGQSCSCPESALGEPCTCTQPALPPRLMFGGQVRLGYQFRYFGLELGGNLYQGWANATDQSPSALFLPSGELRIGPAGVARGVLGIGSPFVTTLRHPGFYCGADVAAGPIDLEARLGAFRAGASLFDDSALRGDLAAYLPLTSRLQFRIGGSLSDNDSGPGGEWSLGLRGTL